jgi:hypothetical protein
MIRVYTSSESVQMLLLPPIKIVDNKIQKTWGVNLGGGRGRRLELIYFQKGTIFSIGSGWSCFTYHCKCICMRKTWTRLIYAINLYKKKKGSKLTTHSRFKLFLKMHFDSWQIIVHNTFVYKLFQVGYIPMIEYREELNDRILKIVFAFLTWLEWDESFELDE